MKGKGVVILGTAVVLLLLLIFPTVYLQAETRGYLDNIGRIKQAIREKDGDSALALFDEKLAAWDENNTLILAFSPHAETENIKDSIVKLQYSLVREEYALALERADRLYTQINHLIDGSRLSWENIF